MSCPQMASRTPALSHPTSFGNHAADDGTIDVTPDEAKILEEAHRLYPVTVDQLRRALPMRPAAFDLALRSLVAKGMVVLEPLEDVTFVRPLATTKPPPPPPPPDEDDPAFM